MNIYLLVCYIHGKFYTFRPIKKKKKKTVLLLFLCRYQRGKISDNRNRNRNRESEIIIMNGTLINHHFYNLSRETLN
jgi:hypothetical protein